MKEQTDIKGSPIDWDRIDDIWYVAGFGCVHLDEAMLHGRGNPDWTEAEMNKLFLNRAHVQASCPFQVKWEEFDKEYGGVVFRLGRGSLLKAILAFSQDASSIRSTCDIYHDIRDRLGLQLSDHGDDFSSYLPDFYYGNEMSAEDFFFNHFLPAKLKYSVLDPIKFATWVQHDARWHVMVTLCSV